MAGDRVVAVVGATGKQGGGLVRAIAADTAGGFVARALTRDGKSEAARQLADLGVEVVEADLDEPASIEAAFAGAYGAYCVTFPSAGFGPEKEIEHARTMADAAHGNGLAHVIWSTLEDTRDFVSLDDERMPTLLGKYKVPPFDVKGEADAVFAEVPTTFLRTTFYWENMFFPVLGPKRDTDGTLTLTLPLGGAKLAGIAAQDIGRCAYAILRRPELIGETVSITGENLTGTQMAAALTAAPGESVRFKDIAPADFRGLFPGADAIGNMFQFYQDFEDTCIGARDRQVVLRLHPGLLGFADWLVLNSQVMS
ncbi:NmrA/HSCARG family protein [Fodinicola feengrottensis]|uniref:NmrA/HSCARG family protein n=1 Tax=Fodinicola feengrottensis TaxID=435914 RepID=A0ABN2GCI5_9ACTN